jgi:hypothetical protein
MSPSRTRPSTPRSSDGAGKKDDVIDAEYAETPKNKLAPNESRSRRPKVLGANGCAFLSESRQAKPGGPLSCCYQAVK